MCDSYVLREQKIKELNKKVNSSNNMIVSNNDDAHFKIDLTSNKNDQKQTENNGWKKPKIIFNNSD